jgi:hypothetical protein
MDTQRRAILILLEVIRAMCVVGAALSLWSLL